MYEIARTQAWQLLHVGILYILHDFPEHESVNFMLGLHISLLEQVTADEETGALYMWYDALWAVCMCIIYGFC